MRLMVDESRAGDLTESETTWNSLAWRSVLGALWLVSVIIFGDALLHELWVLIHQPINIDLFVAAAGVFFLVFVCLWISKRSQDMDSVHLWWLALFVVVSGLLLRLIWVLIFDSYQSSDFNTYLLCGIEIVTGQIDTCLSPLHWQRGLFVTAPVVSLFGPKLAAIESFNLLIYFLSAILFILLAYRLAGLRVAILGLVLFSVAPDLFYPVTLASHDLHGLFWLLLFFLLTIGLEQLLRARTLSRANIFWLVSGSLLLGLVLTALEYSRSYGLMAAAALALVVGAIVIEQYKSDQRGWKGRVSPVIFLLFLPLLVQSVAEKKLDDAFFRPQTTRPHAILGLITATDITGANRYHEMKIWNKGEFPELVVADRLDYAVSRWVHEWSHNLTESVAYLFRKNHVLADGGGNFYFATIERKQSLESGVTFDQVGRVNNLAWQLQDRTVRLLNILILGLCLSRILLVFWLPFRRSELVVVAFSAVTYLSILLLLEAQPRYTVFLLLPAAYMGGQVLAWLFSSPSGRADSFALRIQGSTKPLLAGMSLLLVIIVLTGAGLKFLGGAGHPLSDLSSAQPLQQASLQELLPEVNAIPVVLETQFNRVGLGLPAGEQLIPGNAMGARIMLPAVPDGDNVLEGFLILNPKNILGNPSLAGLGLEVCLYKDRQTVMCYPIREFEAHFLQIKDADVDRDSRVELTLLVKITRPIDIERVPGGPVILLEHLRVR